MEKVNKTIEELKQQLATAEAEASELNFTVSWCHRSIQAVRNKYSKQLGRLEKKGQSIAERRADWSIKKGSVQKAKGMHEAAMAAHTENMLNREEIIKEIQSESAAAKDFVDIMVYSFVEVNEEGDSEADDDDNLKIEVSMHEVAAAEVRQDVAAIETDLRSFQKELTVVDTTLPVLETEKKAATDERDFKKAGSVTKEIKEVKARKQRLAKVSTEAMEQHRRAQSMLQNILELQAEAKAKAAERAREMDMKQMEFLRKKIDALRAVSKQASTASSEQFATERWDEGESDITIACVGAFVLESQIHLLQQVLTDLGERYGGEGSAEHDMSEDASVQSGPSFDSDNGGNDNDSANNDSSTAFDKAALARYDYMVSHMKGLEVKEMNINGAATLEGQSQSDLEKPERNRSFARNFSGVLKKFTGKAKSSDDAVVHNNLSSEDAVDENVVDNGSSNCEHNKETEANFEAVTDGVRINEEDELKDKVTGACSDHSEANCSKEGLEQAQKNTPDTETASEEDEKEELGSVFSDKTET